MKENGSRSGLKEVGRELKKRFEGSGKEAGRDGKKSLKEIGRNFEEVGKEL